MQTKKFYFKQTGSVLLQTKINFTKLSGEVNVANIKGEINYLHDLFKTIRNENSSL